MPSKAIACYGKSKVISQGFWVRSLAVLPDGRLASGGDDGKIRLWPKDGAGEPKILPQGSAVWSLAVRPDGWLASGGGDGTIKLWPSEGTGEPVVLKHERTGRALAVPEGWTAGQRQR